MSELKNVGVDRLSPHPENPRLRLRDDVVTQIAAEITRVGFGQEHALLARPVEDGYQILSGHHRHEAAKRAGLFEVPCWVRDMDDEEAFMQLILANTQGELSPLEEGHHVAKYVERAEVGAGRGNKGGLREYARRLNKNADTLRQRRDAYRVYEKCRHVSAFSQDQFRHLYEVGKAAEDTWEPLAKAFVAGKWSVKDTVRKVGEVGKFDIPERHAPWLPQAQVVEAYLNNERPTPSAVQRLADEADRVLDAIEENGTEEDAAEFKAWLVANTGGDSWDHRKISSYHADLIRTWAERRDQASGGRIRIEPCRASELLDRMEPGTADLVFTDPPYPVEYVDCWTELGELAVKALKPGGLLVAYTGQYWMPEALDRLRDTGLSWFWMFAAIHTGAFFRMNATHVQCGWKPLLVMRNGPGDLPNWHKDFATYFTDGDREKTGHEWQQAEAEAAYWIGELSKPDDLVVDPFVGSGTTAAACKELGRRFIGCDTDANKVDEARERVA